MGVLKLGKKGAPRTSDMHAASLGSCYGSAVNADPSKGGSLQLERLPDAKAKADMPGGATCDLTIRGMTCAACVTEIESALKRTRGVVSASVHIRGGSARVGYVPDVVDVAAIKQAIRAIGYEVSDALPVDAERRRLPYLWPLAIFVLIGVFLGVGLTLNPRLVPSPLIGKPVPVFQLPPVQGRTLGLASDDLRGEVAVVNVFASWCTACREEHPLWMELSRQRAFSIHGLNYKDAPADASRWLDELGDPYIRTGADRAGRVGIDWGVYGVPETYVVDKHGVIRDKIIGAITRKSVDERLLPLVRQLQAD